MMHDGLLHRVRIVDEQRPADGDGMATVLGLENPFAGGREAGIDDALVGAEILRCPRQGAAVKIGRRRNEVALHQLSDSQRELSGRPTLNAGADHEVVDGLPRLSSYVAFFAYDLIQNLDVNDHTLFIAEVSNCDYCDHSPLVFFSSRYHLGLGAPFDR
jgi:hypothetical protein